MADREDREFLETLDKKLHSFTIDYLIDCIDLEPQAHITHKFKTNQKINAEEMRNLLEILERGSLLIYPLNSQEKYKVYFRIATRKNKPLLTFLEDQLPYDTLNKCGYDFERLSEYFLRKENVELAENFGIEIRKQKRYYVKEHTSSQRGLHLPTKKVLDW